MLYYLWTVIQDLFCCVTLCALMHVYLHRLCGKKGLVIHRAGLLAGTVAAVALAAVKQTTNKIISSHWNHWTYAVILVFSLVFFVSGLLFGRKEKALKAGPAAVLSVSGAGLCAAMIFFRLPGVALYPFSFNTMGNGFFSAYYMSQIYSIF